MTQDEYIVANRNRRVEDVALELSRRQDLDAPFVLRQIEGYQRMRTKVPHWTEVEGIHFPPRLALEQCSGQPAAEYKASVVARLLRLPPSDSPESSPMGSLPLQERGEENTLPADTCSSEVSRPLSNGEGSGRSLVDLTGGMGVDFSFIAPLFITRTYVEQRAELAEAARHNFPLLGLADAHIVHGDGGAHLSTMESVDLIYLDPARRDSRGGKTVLIEDCEPNVAELLPLLRAKGHTTMVKLSPMLDLHRAIATLHAVAPGCVSEVHVFASGGECKDLLLVIGSETSDFSANEPTIYCADEHGTFVFKPSEESSAAYPMACHPAGYLYEPGPALMKAGAFRSVAARYGLAKLHANSHLYVSAEPVADFPGRGFEIVRTYTFAKADLKALTNDLKAEGGKANLTIRNFPASVADLRKKLKLREGGNVYLFATTDSEEKKIIIACRKPD